MTDRASIRARKPWYYGSQMRAQDPFIGRDILDGQFQILQKVGSGGMGAVYKALQPSMNRMVGIKILHPKLANRKDLVSRFRREARAMSHLTHPNTVKVFLYGELDDGSLYIVMEFLEGKNLNQTVRAEGAFAWERALPILIQACGALDEAHKMGIVHRDLKPENVFLCQQGGMRDFPKVLDFGLAKVTEREMRPGSIILTQEGMVFGTPEFMSPEQAQGKVLSAASDIYSLAVILYEVLTSKLPFEAKTAMDYIQAHVTAKPIPIADRIGRQFPPLLWPVIARALAKEPEQRYASAADFASAMQSVLAGATELPASLTPAPAPAETPTPPIAAPVAPVKRTPPAPQAPAREPFSTKPERPLAKREASASATLANGAANERGTPIGLLVGVAAACLVLGVLITVVAMRVLAR
jgi:serine/threonine protein kinase